MYRLVFLESLASAKRLMIDPTATFKIIPIGQQLSAWLPAESKVRVTKPRE
jgi:hypothetical protein